MNAPGRTGAAVLRALLLAAATAASAREDQILNLGNPAGAQTVAQAGGARRIADINKVTLVMKGGRIYDPACIEQALGIAPAQSQLSVHRRFMQEAL